MTSEPSESMLYNPDLDASQEMINRVRLEMGHTAESAPAAWVWAKEAAYTRHDINSAPRDDSETTISKNVE